MLNHLAHSDFEFQGKMIVWLRMQGACAGCPKSNITLNIQIKQLVKHYFPEVKDVCEYLDPNEDEDIPRAPAES
jgi:Fe-S cluster biogenesis protein NfuA